MPKKHKLTGNFAPEYSVIGITAQARGYKLAMAVNEKLDLHLFRVEDFPGHGKQSSGFILYEAQEKDTLRMFYLLYNRHPEGLLVPSLKGIDAFVIVFEDLGKQEITDLLNRLRQGTGIQAAYEIRVATIKDFDLLMEDLEVHLLNLKRKPEE